jgi:restriction system protein
MIPDYQSVMLPLLQFLGDRKPHSISKVFSAISSHFNLTEQEANELLPSGRNKILNNRIHWARAHLKMAGLIENVEKGSFKITEKGENLLQENPTTIDLKLLKNKFPEYQESFRYKKKEDSLTTNDDLNEGSKQTPEELFELGYSTIRKSLEQELLSKLKTVHPSFFERIVVELLVKMGYGGSIAEALLRGRVKLSSNKHIQKNDNSLPHN